VEADEVLVIGHAPHLDLLLAQLVGAPGVALSSLKKSGAVSVAGGATGTGQIEWLLTPRALRRIGRG
jgi:phosphohistidine phosphatase SixA